MTSISIGDLVDRFLRLREAAASLTAVILAVAESLSMDAEHLDETGGNGSSIRSLARELNTEALTLQLELEELQ